MRLMEVSAPTDGFAPSWADDPRSSIAILKIAMTACYRGRLMSQKLKSVWYITVLYAIAVGLVLALPACGDFKKDFLCRPAGVCVDAADGGTGSN
jgi:hypothetical protein